MTLVFKPIHVEQDFAQCVAFRRDAYVCSFQSLTGFEHFLSGYRERIVARINHPCWFYRHIWLEGEIIGQLEFRTYCEIDDVDEHTGYVNLIYLKAEYRGQGLAGKLQDYIANELIAAGCQRCLLSVSRTNQRALRHYQRFGWHYLKPNPKHAMTDFYQRVLS
ncbi:GNAT family N-acetyltransferase [Celerinatantimonas diazotrophica]|nr:GNAT family N-acetyltransferase [Celerinatantimonas diazotrophica]